MSKACLDIVIAGPDGSGTSTQIQDAMAYFRSKNLLIADLRGNETDVLFHSKSFQNALSTHTKLENIESYAEFKNKLHSYTESVGMHADIVHKLMQMQSFFLMFASKRLSAESFDLGVINAPSVSLYPPKTYGTQISSSRAEVWVLEEPPYRGSGQTNRFFFLKGSLFGYDRNATAEAHSYATYRLEEFYRFRKPLRESGSIILRSRSEESACYQVQDKILQSGLSVDDFINLPGNALAFANPPTHIFVACAPDWTRKECEEFNQQRMGTRVRDDYESNIDYQMLVNERYSTSWLNDLYQTGCAVSDSVPPVIYRLDMRLPKQEIKQKLTTWLDSIVNNRL